MHQEKESNVPAAHSDIFAPVITPPTCKLRWDNVDPAQKQWFCCQCQHSVHNLSAMTRREAEKFMRATCTGRRCISFLQDENGRAIFRQTSLWYRSIAASLMWLVSAAFLFVTTGCTTSCHSREKTTDTTASAQQPRWTGF